MMDKRQMETVLRMAVTGIQQAKSRVSALADLDSIDRPDLIRAQSKLSTAVECIEEWAGRNNYTISKGMPT